MSIMIISTFVLQNNLEASLGIEWVTEITG